MKIFTDQTEWYIAESLEVAIQFSIETYGFESDMHNPDNWYECDPEDEFTFRPDPYNKPGEIEASFKWFAENYPEGFLASTEY